VIRLAPQAGAIIRPASPADMAALGDFFAGLSARTRYLRFFGPVTPTAALLRLLSGADVNVDAVVAVRGGVIIGHAMAADRPGTEGSRCPAGVRDPPEPTVTEIGVVVADAWQGRGVGSAMVRALVTRAQARSVTSMAIEVLHTNRRVLSMIERRWPAAEIDRFRECATIHVRLPRSEQLPSAVAVVPVPRAAAAGGNRERYVGARPRGLAAPRVTEVDDRIPVEYGGRPPFLEIHPGQAVCSL